MEIENANKPIHKPVLLKEVIEFLDPEPGQRLIDATCGLGGHARAILERIGPKGKLLCLDVDRKALELCKKSLKGKENVVFVEGNFRDLKAIARSQGFANVDGILYDLGLSSFQLEDTVRGFSFRKDSPLDMRMSEKTFLLASDLVNSLPEKDLAELFTKYGEERFARRIAKQIVKNRTKKRIERTSDLVDIILKTVPYKFSRIHPATKVFQALRIAVNQELENLESSLPQAVELLRPFDFAQSRGGRVVVISFHSLEDRIVKNFFKEKSRSKKLKILTKKPIIPKIDEIKMNPRSRSAKLRAAEKID